MKTYQERIRECLAADRCPALVRQLEFNLYSRGIEMALRASGLFESADRCRQVMDLLEADITTREPRWRENFPHMWQVSFY